MISEDLESEFSYIDEDRDQFTQTSASSVLFNLPLLKDDDDKSKANTVFEYCQIIQDPEYPKTVTIVKEFVTEEVKNYSINTGENSKASRYKYTREVIHPFFTPKSDVNESCEILVKEAIRSAKKDFPDFYPSLEVYHSQKSLSRIRDRVGESSFFSKVDAQTSYLNMDQDPDPDKVCLTDCNQAEDPKKCKQACRELNEARKSAPPGSPQQKPPCGVPVHKPPKCEKPPNCRPKIKKTCSPKSSSSNFDNNQDEEDLITDLNTNKDLSSNPDEVIIIDVTTYKNLVTGANKELNTDPEEVIEMDLNTNIELNEMHAKEDNKVDLGNIVPNIIYESNSSSVKSFIEAHNEAVSTIKVAMEDFMGILYKTTQDTVSLIATESAKALARIKASEPANTDILDSKLDNDCSEPLKKISFFRKNNEVPKDDDPPGPAATMMEKVLKTADSALCIISNQITKSLEDLPKQLGKFNERSSPYDQPKTESKPSPVSTPDTTNGVFSALKNKIYSIFSDSEKNSDTPLSGKSSGSLISDDSEDV